MRTPPRDLTEAEVGVAVAARWHVVAESIEYAPVGFGSHHWGLTEAASRRWFVTADAVADSAERLAELTVALTTAYALRHRCGLVLWSPRKQAWTTNCCRSPDDMRSRSIHTSSA